jgi:hypothetical protein
MDLSAADLADEKARRLTRVSMIACFVIASAMLITSLAMANGSQRHTTLLPATITTAH